MACNNPQAGQQYLGGGGTVRSFLRDTPSPRTLRAAGLLLALGGLAFVGIRIWDQAERVPLDRVGATEALYLFLLAIIYGGSNVLPSLGWRHLLQREGVAVSRWWAIRTYGMTQVAKYLPGNVFHFAGRQAIGMAGGLPGWALVRSAFWDIGVIVGAGAVLSSLTFMWWWADVQRAVQCSATLLVLGGVFGIGRWLGSNVTLAFLHAVSFLVIAAVLFVVVVGLMSEPTAVTGPVMGRLVAGYLVSWLLGTLTPGAPAGLGVREVALLVILRGAIPESDLLLAIVLFRVVTTGGDGLLFCGLSMGREVAPK